MVDVTSGPPQGGMLGNALDKGAGYGPFFDHFGFSCGLEVVLGNGEILRTGDGALNAETVERPSTTGSIRRARRAKKIPSGHRSGRSRPSA